MRGLAGSGGLVRTGPSGNHRPTVSTISKFDLSVWQLSVSKPIQVSRVHSDRRTMQLVTAMLLPARLWNREGQLIEPKAIRQA